MSTHDPSAEPAGVILSKTHLLPDGGIARGPGPDMRLPGLRWRARRSGLTTISLPFSACVTVASDTEELSDFLLDYEHRGHFTELVARFLSPGRVRVIDLNSSLPILLALGFKLRRLGLVAGLDRWFWRARLDNLDATVPFIDAASYMDAIENHGPPFIDENSIAFPPLTEDPMPFDIDVDIADSSDLWREPTALALDVIHGFGIPTEKLQEAEFSSIQDRAAARQKRLFGE